MALVVQTTRDYKNNQIMSEENSTIIITSPLYVGGVPQDSFVLHPDIQVMLSIFTINVLVF